MKKLIIFLLISIFILSGCANKSVSTDKINAKNINSISITKIPSHHVYKTITEKEDIQKVISFINLMKKEKIDQQYITGGNIHIRMKGKEDHSF